MPLQDANPTPSFGGFGLKTVTIAGLMLTCRQTVQPLSQGVGWSLAPRPSPARYPRSVARSGASSTRMLVLLMITYTSLPVPMPRSCSELGVISTTSRAPTST